MSTQEDYKHEQPTDPGDDVTTLEVMPASALQVHITAEIDTQIATAKQYPRSLTQFKRKAMSLATVTPDVADSCNYGIPRGGKIITGPSTRLAEIIASTYGNVRAGARVILNDGKAVTAQGICHDLETNYCVTVEVRRSILQNEKKWDAGKGKMISTGRMIPMTEDMQIMTGNAACSIALRNAIFKVVPRAAWWDVYEQAVVVAKGDAATLPDRRKKALEFFNGQGIKTEIICRTLGVKEPDDIDLEILASLSAMKTALKNKEVTLEALFPPVEDTAASKADKATKATETKVGGKAGAKKVLDKLKGDLEKKEGQPPVDNPEKPQ